MTTHAKSAAAVEETVQPQVSASGLLVTYRTRDGRPRLVLVGVNRSGVWLVYDVPQDDIQTRRGLLVDHLLGVQEKVEEARGLALEYATCQTAFAEGRREEHPNPNPLPRPIRVPMRLIRRHARAAAQAVADDRDLPAEGAWFRHVLDLADAQQRRAQRAPKPQTVAA